MSRPLRVGVVSHWFDPEGGAAAHPGIVARAIRDAGHEVTVLTGFPTYPAGTVFDGYRNRPWRRERLDGMTVHRSAIFPSHDTHAARRAANYLSFAASASAVGLGALRGVDVVYVYSSPATAAIPAMALRAVRGTPFVLHIQDLWPDTVTSSGFVTDEGRTRRVESALHRFCDSTYRRASRIAVTSPGMADLIAARGVPREKLTWLPNWADEGTFHPATPSAEVLGAVGPLRPFTAMYAGNLGELQSLDTVVRAAEILRDRTDIGFVLVGDGVAGPRLRASVERLGLDNVRFAGPQPLSAMAQVLATADVQLVTLLDRPIFAATLPSKLQANLAAGAAVIGAVRGDAAGVITRSGAGEAVPPEDPAALAAAVARMADLPAEDRRARGARALGYHREHFAQERLLDRLADVLAQAAGGPAHG